MRALTHHVTLKNIFFFFFFLLPDVVVLGCATQSDSNVTGVWRSIACINVNKFRALPAADTMRVARRELRRVARHAQR